MAIEVFNRMEIKYLLTDEDKDALLAIIGNYMDSDPYNIGGKPYSISNIYLDTTSDELIRKSLEKPEFKEKIRLRSYGTVPLNSTVFLESKKKYDSTVNKRRTNLKLCDAYKYFETGIVPENPEIKMNHQVMKEIDYVMNFYKLQPRVFISYDRLAFFEKNNSDFRLTIDKNIQTRREDLRLDSPAYGTQLLKPGQWLMEAKAFKAFPLWFVRFLSNHKIFSTSFSKYGAEYKLYLKKKDGKES
ncbi:MAG: polyphosphate polymerase domain-containing protein [Treponema sp.]|nr:polyphosphate polymerase domain-containing protein [Treponema sp.]